MIIMEFTLSILAHIRIIYIYEAHSSACGRPDRHFPMSLYRELWNVEHVSVELQDFQHCTASRVASSLIEYFGFKS